MIATLFKVSVVERYLYDILLPLYLFEVGFNLPLNSFYCSIFYQYEIAVRQPTSFSWWNLIANFIDCSLRGEPTLISVFKRLYQLKVTSRGALIGLPILVLVKVIMSP